MPNLGKRLLSLFFFTEPDVVLSNDIIRNEEVRLHLTSARIQHNEREKKHEVNLAALDDEIIKKRERYSKKAKPLLDEFDDIALAEHYYEEVKNLLLSQHSMVERLAKQELRNFAYMSKKLISVSLNFEAFRQKLKSGETFKKELEAVLEDAESKDLRLISAPLFAFADVGVPHLSTVQAAAFNLARAIEDTGKIPADEPVRGWLDFLKFRTTFSPTTLQMNETLSHTRSEVFMRHISMGEYHKALKIADEVFQSISPQNDASYHFFDETFRNFRKVVFPRIAADMLSIYAQSSLNDSRFACVEGMIKD